MLRMVHSIDPITGKDLGDKRDLPYVVENTSDGELTIYFESEESRQAYLEMPPKDPAKDFKKSLSDPVDNNIDEG